MDFELKGKRALVTGGGRGIGRAIALCLAAEDAQVAVVSRTSTDVKRLVDEMGGEDLGHRGVAMDLMDEGAPFQLVETLKRGGFAPIDIVVHNLGGTLGITDPFCSVEDWQIVWRFNLGVAIDLNLLLLPSMRGRRWGRIVHMSSISAMESHGPITYSAVKAALTAYSRGLGRLLSSEGVVVTAVLAGAVLTEGGYWDVASADRPEQVAKFLADRMAIHRFGAPDEIGTVVAFLCSEQASFCVGSVVPVDGGQGRGFFGL